MTYNVFGGTSNLAQSINPVIIVIVVIITVSTVFKTVSLEICHIQAEKTEWLSQLKGVALSSDAFFPFPDNIHRASQVICG